jgi:peptide/nickel transport system substrate-binding protein
MKKGIIGVVLGCLLGTSLILSSCGTSTSTTTLTQATTQPTTVISTLPKTTSTAVITTQATTTSPASNGNWWDSLGTPQYGGEMVLRLNNDPSTFDPDYTFAGPAIMNIYFDHLFSDNWTLDPAVFPYNIDFRPPDYVTGSIAASYEFTDPKTFVVHLRQGIHWQNIPPVNGRPFTAADVVFHYNRMYGLGGGFTTPSPGGAGNAMMAQLVSVTAIDQYTVVFKEKTSNPEIILEALQASDPGGFEASEAVALWGNLSDWHHAIGTGPFILQDYVTGSSATLIKNPNYWGYDERYPKNQIPYINTLKVLVIPDPATALAAIRTGKIDQIDGISQTQALAVQKTNREILQVTVPLAAAETIDLKNNVVPFNDVRVREAMQMAINLPDIAKNYYGGTASSDPSTVISNYMAGWGFPYNQWPQSLKDQYAYNPTAAKQLLAAAGYPNGFNTDVVADAAGNMDLLQIVKSYFAAININMDIKTMETNAWLAYVRIGHKYDQMAQRSGAGSLGITYQPTQAVSRFTTGAAANYEMVSDPNYDDLVNKMIAATNLADVKEYVKEQSQYVAQQHLVISLLQPMSYSLYQPWLKGYSGQTRSITGSNNPFFMGFYAARFWIDQKLKQSMGE